MLIQEVLTICFLSSRGGRQTAIGFMLLVHHNHIGVFSILLPLRLTDGEIADSI